MQEILRDFGVCCRDKRDINTPWLRSNSKLMDRSFHGYLRVTELGATPAESWEADSLSPLDSLLSRLCCDSRCRCLQPCQAVGGAVIACTDRKGCCVRGAPNRLGQKAQVLYLPPLLTVLKPTLLQQDENR